MSEIQTTEGTQPVATEQTTTATAQPILSSTQQPTQPTSGKTWKEAISQEYRSNPNIEKFTELDALVFCKSIRSDYNSASFKKSSSFKKGKWSAS